MWGTPLQRVVVVQRQTLVLFSSRQQLPEVFADLN